MTLLDIAFWAIMVICYAPALILLLALLAFVGKWAEWVLDRLQEIF